ncbi:MAG: 2-C-methyl-D-erythritol 4-phosphate cytidylyltransferase [archaeon]|uniref:2-C-methyl-D-erythritol 4-phosphate cytidylyltransferase n=1 Tax=Methanobrevibacter gottschalkii DSM 11977 TaxID=1122229 RepID=A0A3N5BKL0_9EURY|nr:MULTISPECIES: 2-C-methyl-D-erythritol 4-phosphate cytidylyltransferase [Methanobrevibacter]MCQ2970403.1 2-C-methyl-D-erythritol 4-phosphate cytidylyltransferase [archaeon]OED01024.1 2-C-methyl-D-erythritol 4-phosphate cytidylyltransferase [Methanobrevibacter sp. A27]RPF50218.1 2-C-methyl-D-erythritol 4-phosphate cytidylyltransferase [Methanobrevibacter gottschalkii DSM 11977]
MIFAAILAGGIGSRMGGTDTPKQFLTLGNKPVIIHTIEKFVINEKIDKIIVLTPKNFINHTNHLIEEYILYKDDIIVIEGGRTRNDTLMNGIDYINEHYGIDEDSIILTHDSVRPFVTHRIIEDNIDAAKKYGACDTVIPATDTIVESINGKTIESIPVRDYYYQGQTPQSFNIKKLFNLINSLTEEESNILTDACKIFALKDEDVYLVEGELTNIKITYPYDLKLANTILEDIHD